LLAAGLAVAELVALREAFLLLQGDELLTLICIATTVMAFGLGALFPAGLFGTGRGREAGFLFFLWLAGLAAPAGVVFVRMLSHALVRDNAVLNPVHAFAAAGVAAAPMGLLAGCAMAFALSREAPPSGTCRNKYALFALGLAAGCGVFTHLVADRFPPLPVALCVCILLLTTSAVLGYRFGSAALVLSPPIWISLLVAITISCSPLCQMLDFHSQRWVFGRDDVEVSSSPAGVVAMWTQGRQATVALNGVAMVRRGQARRPAEAVETAAIPLLLHPEPQRVLLVGGSNPDVIEEILQQHVMTPVEYVMPDEAVQAAILADTDLGSELKQAEAKGDLVIRREEGDVRTAIRNLRATYPYDVILVDLPGPSNVFLNRFYTRQCLSDLKALLRPKGILAVHVRPLERAGYAQQKLAFSSFLRTFSRVFPGYILAGNETRLCIGGASPEPLPTDPGLLERRRVERGVGVVLPPKGSSDDLLRKGLPTEDPQFVGTPINGDLRPVTSLCSAVGWLAAMPPSVRGKAMLFFNVDVETLAIALVVIAFAVSIVAILVRRRRVLGAVFGLCSGQFIAGALLGGLLLSDQCIFGTLFRDMGLLGTAFFIGATAAAVIALARRGQSLYGGFVMPGLLLLLGIVASVMPSVLGGVATASDTPVRLLHLFITLPLLAAVTGCSAGGLVPAAASVLAPRRNSTGQAASPVTEQEAKAAASCRAERAALAVSALSGSLGLAFGAILLLPVVTITGSCYFCALVASVGVIVLLLTRGE
jgi:predicted membrane-bound spermidine synthase